MRPLQQAEEPEEVPSARVVPQRPILEQFN
jgi:hypothetical protein